MKKTFFYFSLFTFLIFAFELNAQERVIFDSDMSSDWDDVGDIAVLHAFADLGEIEILACMGSSTNGGTALCMSSINHYFGRTNIPCGRNSGVSSSGGGYAIQIANEFPHPLYAGWSDCPLAVDLYRKVLAEQPDHSVTIVTAGFLNNLHELMLSSADQYSPLNGTDLIRQKVKLLACAGGMYPQGDEFNFKVVPEAAEYVVNNWPVAASYVGFNIGQAIKSGAGLASTPADNPIRRVYVDIIGLYPHPTWTQVILYHAIRQAESQLLWDYVTTGRNRCDATAHNWWDTTGEDPTGDQEQLYLLEVQRYPIQEALETLVMNSGAPKSRGTNFPPNQPSNLRATVATNTFFPEIDLEWADNSWNETGFVIERKIDNGVYVPIATVNPEVTTYHDTDLPTTVNVSYRIAAINEKGNSGYTYVRVYSDWTEIDFVNSGPIQPSLYRYYQYGNLRWNRGGDFRPDHVALNNNSTHGQDLTINVQVGNLGSEGSLHVYFFYQDAKNWYRLFADNISTKFEKSVNGTITHIGGVSGEKINIGDGSMLQTWKIIVSNDGTLRFLSNNNVLDGDRLVPELHEMVTVSDVFSFDTGKIGLGGKWRTPVWQNFHFEIGATGTGIASASADVNDMVIYPNPATEIIYFSKNVSEVSLFSLQGQLILSAHNSTSLNVSSLAKGLYMVRLKDSKGNQKVTKVEVR
jgi:hypothetical protein